MSGGQVDAFRIEIGATGTHPEFLGKRERLTAAGAIIEQGPIL